MKIEKIKRVAVIHQSDRMSDVVIKKSEKLSRRLTQAVRDLFEDGYSNFIIPIEYESSFVSRFVTVIIKEKRRNPGLTLTVMLPYDKGYLPKYKSLESADEILYAQHPSFCDTAPLFTERLHELSTATIVYIESNDSDLTFETLHALYNKQQIKNIVL